MGEDREPAEAQSASAPDVDRAPGTAESATGGFEALLRGDPRRMAGRDPALLRALQQSAGNQTVLRLLRTVAPPAVEAGGQEQTARPATPLVADDGADPAPGQMRLGPFLAEVETRVRAIAERELAETIYRAAGCPWIDHWLGYYRQRSLDEVDAAIRRYSPEAATAATADGYLRCIETRVAEGIRGWQATGQLPEGAPTGAGAPPGAAAGAQTVAASPPVSAAAPTAVARTPGKPLDAPVSARMGGAFGADFSSVRVHTGPEAAAYAARERAHAVTIGRDIAFAAGRYEPGTPAGEALLAHELAHVQQQTGEPSLGRLEDPLLEADADLAAVDAMTALHLPGTRRAGAARRTGAGAQRCGEDIVVPQQAPPRPYAEIVTELQSLRARKQGVLTGQEPDTVVPEIDARIEEIGAELRRMGVKLETAEIMDRVATDPKADLMKVAGQIVQSPTGPAHRGDKLEWQAVLDYVPPGRLVEYGWRWQAKGRTNMFIDTFKRSNKDRVSVGSGFWSGEGDITKHGGMEVFADVYLGDDEKAVTRLTTGWIELPVAGARDFALKSSQKVTIIDAPVTIEPAGWAPTLGEHWIDWEVDGKRAATDYFVLNRAFKSAGTHTVTAHLYKKGDALLRSRGDKIATQSIDVVVQDPGAAADKMLDQMSGEQAPPSTKKLETSIEASIKEIERRVSEGGEQRDFWVDRLKAQRKRLEKLREQIPDRATANELPADPSGVKDGQAYTGPVKAVLILPSGGGPQPLSIYLRTWQEGSTWKARIVDMTSADVYGRNGSGKTAMEAYEGAFRSWIDDHPYPRGAKVRYEFTPPGWSVPTTFKCRDTAWETVKAWVDGILTVGGIVVGGLLLLTPEPTGATKALGYLFITASAARSAIAIYENLELGIDPLDPRNVIEGLSILTSALGVSGSLLRQYGVRTISPLVYRVGNWTVMTSLAGDAGTLAFISKEAMAQLRAVQGDPTKDDSQKNAEFLRVAAQLFASGAMFFASNKDLIKQGIKPSDFFKMDPRAAAGSKQPALSTGSRLDLGLELKKAGDLHTAERISAGKISDGELLDRHLALPWLKTGAPLDVAEVSKRLTPKALAAVGDVPVKDIRKALDDLADDALLNKLAEAFKSGARVRDVAAGMGKIQTALAGHPDRIAAMKRGAALEAAGSVAGFEAWVKQTAKRIPDGKALTPEHVEDVSNLTGELNALEAVSGDPTKTVKFTPAPEVAPGQPTPRSFDITVTGKGSSTPERLIEVHTEAGPVSRSIDLHAGVAHAASKLPLERPKPVKGGPKSATVKAGETLPTASKEAAVVLTEWPPPAAGNRTVKADGSYEQKIGGPVGSKQGHLADDLVRELNGTMLDSVGAQYLDRVTIVDGKTGKKIFSLVNRPDPTSADGARKKWTRE